MSALLLARELEEFIENVQNDRSSTPTLEPYIEEIKQIILSYLKREEENKNKSDTW